MSLKAPFPYFGGKSRIAHKTWKRFGRVVNYVEPFFGSGAMLLARPRPFEGAETINDADGFVANFWRSLAADPDGVAHHADWPVNENDLHARHAWLVGRREDITTRLEGDPGWYDVRVAGWWVWGLCAWIGGGWCSGDGPWQVIDGKLMAAGSALGIKRQRVHLSRGQEIKRQRVHLSDAGRGINRKIVHLGNGGRGINRQLVHLGKTQGINRQIEGDTCAAWFEHLQSVMRALADRLRRVRVCCGDWSRVCGSMPTVQQGLTAVFLDPPYADTAERDPDLYAVDSLSVAHDARDWAIEWGDHPRMRIALCGYEGEHAMPDSWECLAWKARGGYANLGKTPDDANGKRERVWFSPHCIRSKNLYSQMSLLDHVG